jgi:hypothetical protein
MMQAGSKQLEEGRRDHELKTKGLLAARTLEVVVIAAWIEQGVFLDFFFLDIFVNEHFNLRCMGVPHINYGATFTIEPVAIYFEADRYDASVFVDELDLV